MDTEAIAGEIVRIRNRLDEIDKQVEGASDVDVDDERRRLGERLRFLQGKLSADGAGGEQDEPAGPGSVQYLPPA